MSPEQAGAWMAGYYLQPDPDGLIGVIRALASNGGLKGQQVEGAFSGWLQRLRKPVVMTGYGPVADEPIIAFASKVFAQNPERIGAWLDAARDLPEGQQRSLWISAWSSGAPGVEVLLRAQAEATSRGARFVQALIGQKMRRIEEIPLVTPSILDMQWGAFFATGEERYVLRVVEALGLVASPQGTPAFAMGTSALWSLQSNAKQHPRVREICAGLLPHVQVGMKTMIESIVSGAPAP